MTPKALLAILCVAAAASPVSAARQEPVAPRGAPAWTATTKYCLRVLPVTGTILERIKCFTRDEWAELGVDLDKEWPKEGVRTLG